MKIPALVLFVLMYVLMIAKPKYRPCYALVTAAIFLVSGILPFGLLSGATLGGNIPPIGASANIAAVGLLRKEGYRVSFGEFMRIGIPYTFAAVLTGYLYFWFIWA